MVRDFDLYPDVESLLVMERKYGDAINYEDINGVKKRKKKRSKKLAADGTQIPDGSTQYDNTSVGQTLSLDDSLEHQL